MSREILTLATLDPALQRQFADAIEAVTTALRTQDHHDPVRKAQIVIKLEFVHDLERETTEIEAGLTCKLPRYRTVLQKVEIDESCGDLMVDTSQGNLFELEAAP